MPDTHGQVPVRERAVSEVAKWLAAAAGEDRPSSLTLGDAADLLDGLVADGLVVLATGEPPRCTCNTYFGGKYPMHDPECPKHGVPASGEEAR